MFISSPHLNSSLSPPYKPYTALSHHVNCQIAIWVQRGVNPHALPTELNTVCPTGMITLLVKKVETACFNHHTVCFMGGKEELMWSLMTTMTIFLKAETHIWVWSLASYGICCQENVRLCEHRVWFRNTMSCITGWVCMTRVLLFD